MNKKIKACIFDLDGTIADTIDTITYYGNRALEKYRLPHIDRERYKYLVGNGYKVLIRRMLEEVNAYSDDLFDEMSEYYHDDYETDSLYLTKPYDGIETLLEKLKTNGIKTAVLSNKPHGAVSDVINAFFKKDTFDILMGQNGTFPLKPDPSGLIRIIEDFGLSKDEVVYIGDTSIDMCTGKSAGVFLIGCEWGFRTYDELIKSGADVIVKHPSKIADIIGITGEN